MIGLKSTIARGDMIRCVLCNQAPCDIACEKVKPAALLRSIWFGNEQTAAQRLPEAIEMAFFVGISTVRLTGH